MLDLSIYLKEVDSSNNIQDLLSLFKKSMARVGLEIKDLIEFGSSGTPCFSVYGEDIDVDCQKILEVVDQNLSSELFDRGLFSIDESKGSVVKGSPEELSASELYILLHGPNSTFAVAHASFSKSGHTNDRDSVRYAEAIATVFYRKYCAVCGSDNNLVELTNKERQVLKAVSMGQTKRRIAESMGVTNHAIDFHYRNIMKKYQVKKIVVAVVKAIKDENI